MHLVQGWEPAAYDQTNPDQRLRETYDPMAMSWVSHQWNPVPGGTLKGLNGLAGWESIPSWGQMAVVIGVSAIVGYFTWSKWGEKSIRPALKKVPVVGGLMGPARRRRRR